MQLAPRGELSHGFGESRHIQNALAHEHLSYETDLVPEPEMAPQEDDKHFCNNPTVPRINSLNLPA